MKHSTSNLYRNDMTIYEWQISIGGWSTGKGWWHGFKGDEFRRAANDVDREGTCVSDEINNYIAAKLCLIHSEISEALECLRSGEIATTVSKDGKPEGLSSELADTAIRILDLCDHLGIDLGKEMARKMNYNETRTYRHGGKRL